MTAGSPGKRDYHLLFYGQALALVSTGIAIVALGLLAYRIAGAEAGAVFGTALAIKMLTHVTVAPLGAMLADRLPRRPLLVGLDLMRAGVVAMLPWVTEVWQIFALVFVFQAASGVFTPTYQALVPELLRDESDYTRALSRSRLLYELEGAISPSIAAALLLVLSVRGLFIVALLGFLLSALLVLRAELPRRSAQDSTGALARLRRGLAVFRATPRLRALALLNLAVAAATAMVTVNTVVFVQAKLGFDAQAAAVALTVFGIGSALGALAVPRLLARWPKRAVMLAGGALAAAGLLAGAIAASFAGVLILWCGLGIATSLAATPAGMVVRQSGAAADRQAIYVTQFTLANAALLLTYPFAGWVAAWGGAYLAFTVLAALALSMVVGAAATWPREEPDGVGRLAAAAGEELLRGDRS